MAPVTSLFPGFEHNVDPGGAGLDRVVCNFAGRCRGVTIANPALRFQGLHGIEEWEFEIFRKTVQTLLLAI
jgi:hypothetical protein